MIQPIDVKAASMDQLLEHLVQLGFDEQNIDTLKRKVLSELSLRLASLFAAKQQQQQQQQQQQAATESPVQPPVQLPLTSMSELNPAPTGTTEMDRGFTDEELAGAIAAFSETAKG